MTLLRTSLGTVREAMTGIQPALTRCICSSKRTASYERFYS